MMDAAPEEDSIRERWFAHTNIDFESRSKEEKEAIEEIRQLVHKNVTSGNQKPEICESKEALELQIENTLRSLTEASGDALDMGAAAKQELDQRRSHGINKASAAIQKFAANLAKVLTEYSGIAEVVKKAGGPYGNAGYSALSCLLVVAVNKSKYESLITDQLEYMHAFFPRINLLAEIYKPDQKIAELVIDAHHEIVLFARDAVWYFLKRSRRLQLSLRAGNRAIDERVEKIRKTLKDINAWCMVYLHRGIAELAKQHSDARKEHDKLLKKNEKLLKELVDLEHQKQKKRERVDLAKFREQLDHPWECSNCDLERIRGQLQSTFKHHPGSPKALVKFSRMTLDFLKEKEYYQLWEKESSTKLLLLGGKTDPESRSQRNGYSWLTPVATELSTAWNGKLVSFFSCHPDSWWTEKPTLRQAIFCNLYQMAAKDPAMLGQDFFQLPNVKWQNQEDDDLEALTNFTRECVKIVSQKDPVLWIIDRMDVCKQCPSEILQCLKDIVDCDCNLKILTIWDTTSPSVQEDCEWFIKSTKGNLVEGNIGLNQKR